jgi:hypothetical protein
MENNRDNKSLSDKVKTDGYEITLPNGYLIRPYRSGDEDQIVELLDQVFEGWPNYDINCSKLAHWEWKYLSVPLGLHAILIAEDKGRIIACNHGQYRKVRLGDQEYNSQIGGDLAVHPDYRRQGIFKNMRPVKMLLWNDNATDFGLSITVNPIVSNRSLKLGNILWPKKVRFKTRIKDLDLHFKKTNSDFRLRARYRAEKVLSRLNKRTKPIREDLNILDVETFGGEADIFWKEIKDYYAFITVRDADYLNWRYCDRRSGNFAIKAVFDGQSIEGYIVLRIRKNKLEYPIGMIVDLLARPGREEATEILVREATRFFDEQDVNIIQYLGLKNHPTMAIFSRNGYFERESRPIISCRTMSDSGKTALNHFKNAAVEKHHFQYGDLDII